MKKRIVIVEDNDLLTRVLEYRLQCDGYEVAVFGNGEDALMFMNDNSFDMLITDLYMPLMNGLELIQAVRDTLSSTVPILAMSATHEEGLITKLFNMGANDFVIKPFRAGELSIRVQRLIKA